jgi:hypothetical protein
MKKSVAKKWSKALRSGEFKQATCALHNPGEDSYCCLGVLCVLAGKDKAYLRRRDHSKKVDTNHLPGPSVYKDFAGMKSADGCIDSFVALSDKRWRLVRTTLAEMNDSGKSFKQIANFIDKHWKEL